MTPRLTRKDFSFEKGESSTHCLGGISLTGTSTAGAFSFFNSSNRYRPFTAVTGVQIPSGTPTFTTSPNTRSNRVSIQNKFLVVPETDKPMRIRRVSFVFGDSSRLLSIRKRTTLRATGELSRFLGRLFGHCFSRQEGNSPKSGIRRRGLHPFGNPASRYSLGSLLCLWVSTNQDKHIPLS